MKAKKIISIVLIIVLAIAVISESSLLISEKAFPLNKKDIKISGLICTDVFSDKFIKSTPEQLDDFVKTMNEAKISRFGTKKEPETVGSGRATFFIDATYGKHEKSFKMVICGDYLKIDGIYYKCDEKTIEHLSEFVFAK